MIFSRLKSRLFGIFKSSSHSTLLVGAAVSLYLTLFFNQRFIDAVMAGHEMNSLGDYLFVGSAFVLLFGFINLLVSLFGFRYLFKPWLVLLLLTAAAVAYFTNSYGVIIDRNMIQNMVETDVREATELLSGKLFLYLLFFGVIPAVIVARLPIRYASLPGELLNKGMAALLSFVMIGGVALSFYQDYASLFRNNRQVRDLIVPTGYVYAAYSYLRQVTASAPPQLATLGEDAQLGPEWKDSAKKVVSVIVVGETARAENFSLNGYGRETNANLKQEDVIYFDNVHSCGTATAVSLPCMFSADGRDDFDGERQQYTENLLDVFKHAGLPVLWRDNNSGCKDVCNRVESEDLSRVADVDLCPDGECYDMVLMQQLEEKLATYDKGGVIVLHQKGSHGPAYFERVPHDRQEFTPFCHTNQLQQCTRGEIVNAYDNTIAYTDYFLAQLIEFFKQHQAEYDASLVYVSDHGESLGENGIYLHGLPYMIAPDQQTHVPFVVWLSDGFAQRFQIDKGCLAANRSQPYSHDNLFPSMLGLLDVRTALYQRNDDLFQACKSKPMLTQQQLPPAAPRS